MNEIHVRNVARAICSIVTDDDCVMDEPGRTRCNDRNCRIMPIARRALEEARASGPQSPSKLKRFESAAS